MNMKAERCRQVHRSVLIIDDNEDLALSLSCLLECYGCRVDVAFDGPEGVRLALQNQFDIVFVDIGLPTMSGYEVALAIREKNGEPPILLAQTAYSQPEDVRRSFEAGFDGHLIKPVQPAEIVRHVVEGRAALSRRGKGSGGGSKPTDVSKSQAGFPFGTFSPKKHEAQSAWRGDAPRD
ncbi:response regulator [Paludisphaera borealis]|uniref:Transcriptional regulatory protein SrrA n=1 Tax=Paludisphaera borealis TaxID=1387353 RepID=A0A1U7CKV4_9BACT|nr:response regulator [Paludisphaera borealis]APW59570.1 Transcriptional regulatory protein SrrA [Paludisphaera borealis]